MEKVYFQLIFITLSVLVIIIFKKIIIPEFMKNWDKKIRDFVKEISDDSEILEETKKESLEQSNLIEKRRGKLDFVTTEVGSIELVVFMILTVLLFRECTSVLEGAKTFGAFLGGWMVIKILTNHGPWSDKVVGKAYYHQSLIGTLLNVMAGFISGWLIYLALLK